MLYIIYNTRVAHEIVIKFIAHLLIKQMLFVKKSKNSLPEYYLYFMLTYILIIEHLRIFCLLSILVNAYCVYLYYINTFRLFVFIFGIKSLAYIKVTPSHNYTSSSCIYFSLVLAQYHFIYFFTLYHIKEPFCIYISIVYTYQVFCSNYPLQDNCVWLTKSSANTVIFLTSFSVLQEYCIIKYN